MLMRLKAGRGPERLAFTGVRALGHPLVGPDVEILTLIVNGLTLYRVNPKTDKALQCAIEDLELE